MREEQYVCAVRDVIPAYRRGLMAALEKVGYEVAEPEDVLDWIRKFRTARRADGFRLAILHSIREEADIETVKNIRSYDPEVCTIALLLDDASDHYARALHAGAAGAVFYGANPTEIVDTLAATWEGVVRLPQSVVADFARRLSDALPITLDDQSVRYLNKLAAGRSVAEIAREENASLRTMHRRVKALYRRFGTVSRDQAIVAATRQGFITLA